MTTMFGLDESVVAPLMRAIAGAELTTSEVEDRFARASWTGIAEPGDRTAGELVGALGAGAALAAVIEHWSVERIAGTLAEAGMIVRLDEIEPIGWFCELEALTEDVRLDSVAVALRLEPTALEPHSYAELVDEAAAYPSDVAI